MLTIPDTLQLRRVSMEAFENMLLADTEKAYDNYRAIIHNLLGAGADGLPAEVEAHHKACLEWHMDPVMDLVARMAEVVGMTGNDQESINMEADVQQSLAGASGAHMAKAI